MTYYDILGVPSTATKAEIKQAYLKLAKEFHPDKSTAVSPAVARLIEDKFKDIQEAYEMLSKHRADYDNQLRSVAPPPTPAYTPPAPTPNVPVPVVPKPRMSPAEKGMGWAGVVGFLVIGMGIWGNSSQPKKPIAAPVQAAAVPASKLPAGCVSHGYVDANGVRCVSDVHATPPASFCGTAGYPDCPAPAEDFATWAAEKKIALAKVNAKRTEPKPESAATSTEKAISSTVWKHVGSTSAERVKVWINKDHLYEESAPWVSKKDPNVLASVYCDSTLGVTASLGPVGRYAGQCTYTWKWVKEAQSCSVVTAETITKATATSIVGWSQHVDWSPTRNDPENCPIAGTDGAEFSLDPFGATPKSDWVDVTPVH